MTFRSRSRRTGVHRVVVLSAGVAMLSASSGLVGPPHTSAAPLVAASAPSTTVVPNINPWRAGRTLVLPHGGGDGLYPEDTMLAYESTMAMGADAVDVDLRLSADGVVVAIHDSTVTRTTGAKGNVGSMTLAELQRLDAGYTFSRNGKQPFRGKGVRIPSLEEILKRFPGVLLSIDLKDESIAMNAPVCATLRRYRRSTDVFVGSNGDAQILAFRKSCPGIATSATMVDVYASQAARKSNDPAFKPDALVDQPPYRIGQRTLVDKEGLAFAHSHGVAILTWVVNDEKDMKTLIDLGVDGIYTSYPDRLLRLLGRGPKTPRGSK
jgi:glycerophosphoryl diester phosphodiesterase